MACPKFSILIRSLSTSSPRHQLIKPPIQVFGIDGRYATALYSAASKQKTLESVEKDLLKFQDSIKTDAKLREFISNPTIKRLQKAEALKAVSQKAALSPQTSNLLQALAENGRLRNLDGIINAFKLIMSAHRGEVICEVTTARELDANQRKQLETVLKSFLQGKQTLHLSAKVDPSIVGGMIVSIGDRYVDMSVASKIKKYTDLISAAV
ncbi:hypothetical protein ILUMI_05114 [Ignelater luminosus]|uniref:Oligomycin sensitivity conferral protein n=1 Tax=Ignelater luminosus TaxID=2038154 RepID=A0A8K0D7V5_IGNLU|nr:hypothetical protein ILUMI_05114 [Ignelater luminosus]